MVCGCITQSFFGDILPAYSALIRRVLGSLSTEERRAFERKRACLPHSALTLLHWTRRTLSDWKEDCSHYTKWESLLASDDSSPGEDKGVGSGKLRFRQLSKHRHEGPPISQNEKNRKEKNGFVEVSKNLVTTNLKTFLLDQDQNNYTQIGC